MLIQGYCIAIVSGTAIKQFMVCWMQINGKSKLIKFVIVSCDHVFLSLKRLKEQNSIETRRPNIDELVDITTFNGMKNP